jgi:hypothetical protein
MRNLLATANRPGWPETLPRAVCLDTQLFCSEWLIAVSRFV